MNIKIFTTGGSIDKQYSTQVSSFVVGDPVIDRILRESKVTLDYEIEALINKDSLDLTEEDRLHILEKVKIEPFNHIIITHGTDTMIATAKTLNAIQDKVIVITGAMQPAAFKETDAYFNIGSAFIAVQVLPAGVYIVMNGRVFDPNKSIKNVQLDRFENL